MESRALFNSYGEAHLISPIEIIKSTTFIETIGINR